MMKKKIKKVVMIVLSLVVSLVFLANSMGTIEMEAAEARLISVMLNDEYARFLENGDEYYTRISCSVYNQIAGIGAEANDRADFKVAGMAKDTIGLQYKLELVEADDEYSCVSSARNHNYYDGMWYVEGTVAVSQQGTIVGFEKRHIKADFYFGEYSFSAYGEDYIIKYKNS